MMAAITPPARRLGIFGGAFNPIHLAHLRLAEEAREACGLQQVLFLPTAVPPHKPLADAVSFTDRLAMVELAIQDNPAFVASDLEQRRPGKSYSVQTLQLLAAAYPEHELYFLIGMDSFRDLTTWWQYQQLFTLANLVVTRRPGIADEDLPALLPVALRADFCYDSCGRNWQHRSGKRIISLAETYLDISSTGLRQLLANGRSVRYLLPTAVVDYIEQHGLYRGQGRP